MDHPSELREERWPNRSSLGMLECLQSRPDYEEPPRTLSRAAVVIQRLVIIDAPIAPLAPCPDVSTSCSGELVRIRQNWFNRFEGVLHFLMLACERVLLDP